MRFATEIMHHTGNRGPEVGFRRLPGPPVTGLPRSPRGRHGLGRDKDNLAAPAHRPLSLSRHLPPVSPSQKAPRAPGAPGGPPGISEALHRSLVRNPQGPEAYTSPHPPSPLVEGVGIARIKMGDGGGALSTHHVREHQQ